MVRMDRRLKQCVSPRMKGSRSSSQNASLELDAARKPAVHQKIRAGCPAGNRAGEEDDGVGHFLRHPHPPGGIQRHRRGEELRVVGLDALPHSAVVIGVPWRHGIGPDALIRQLESQAGHVRNER